MVGNDDLDVGFFLTTPTKVAVPAFGSALVAESIS